MDEIFYPLPSSLDMIFGLWKESLLNYCVSPDENTLALAVRHTDLLNTALLLLRDQEKEPGGRDYETEAARYLKNPLLHWDETGFTPIAIQGYDDYEAALMELLDHYSREKYITEEIKRISALADLSDQGSSAMELEMKKASAEIALAEKNCSTLTAEYQKAADAFQRVGVVYDSLYARADKAFRNLEASRRAFEIQDAVRLWAATAYLDSRRPEEELAFCRERTSRAQNALALLGGGVNNSDYFSRVTEYYLFSELLDYANKSYARASASASTPIFGPIFSGNTANERRLTRDAIAAPQRELESRINLGYNSLKQTLSSFNNALSDYKKASIRLALLKGENNGVVGWENIAAALNLAGNFSGDLRILEGLWEKVKAGSKAQNVPEALKLLADLSKTMKETSSERLQELWEKGEAERAVYEIPYRELYAAYLEGLADLDDLKTIAVLFFAGSVPPAKKHLENTGNSLMEALRSFAQAGLGGRPEYTQIAIEYAEIVNKVWEDKYSAELNVRKNEWDLQRRDIQEKLTLWRESAAIILEQGRMAWKEGGEKLREGFSTWVKAYQEEYGRINDQWNAAYLEGLRDKEAWAAAAFEAASHASSAAALALLGSGAEAASRAMDTRDPLGFMNVPDSGEGERILAELLDRAGTGYLASAFGSIMNSPESFASVVRTGLESWGLWNFGAALSEASILARTTRREFEDRESRKMAFMIMQTAKDALKLLEDNLQLANDSFKKNMDETFLISGQWRRAGPKYIKDVLVHSTLINSVITEYAEVDGYRYFRFPQTRLTVYVNGDVPMDMDAFHAEMFMDSIYAEINELAARIFGAGTEKDTGQFSIHIGKAPVPNSRPDLDKGRKGIIEDPGSGELGRLLVEFYFWMYKETRGIALMEIAPWEKPIWDSRGSSIEAPSLRSAVDIALKTGIVIAGVMGSPLTAGGSFWGSLALGAAINSADDLLFNVLDIAGGYKSWSEAGFNFGQNLLMNTASSAAGMFFYGLNGSASSFLNSGGFSGFAAGQGIGSVAYNSLTTGLYSMTTGTVSGLLGSVTYSDEGGFGFSGNSFVQSLKGAGIGALSGMTGTFTSGIMDLGLSGFTGELYKNSHKLSGLAGGFASQGVSYALGNDFVLNLFNAGIFFEQDLSAGLVEMHLGRDGLNFQLGNGGADVSIGTLTSAAKGFEAWKVNAEILFANESARKHASGMRTLYTGSGTNRDEYDNILAGRTRIVDTGLRESQSIYDSETGIKTIYLGNGVLEDGASFMLNVILSHESYRDGIDSGEFEQAVELEKALLGHAKTALDLILTYGSGILDDAAFMEAMVYAAMGNDYRSFMDFVSSNYDNSADFWKLVKKENGGWGWMDDKSADFDISDLLNDPNYLNNNNNARDYILNALLDSAAIDGKGPGIISAGRMTPELAAMLGRSVMLNNLYNARSAGYQRQEISASALDGMTMWDALIKDTLGKIAYNALHTTTVSTKHGYPVTLHSINYANDSVEALLKQNSAELSDIENMAKYGCNFMDIISIPQMLTRQTLGAEEVTELWNQALTKNIINSEGYVNDRNALANLALGKLGITNFGIDLSGVQPNNSSLVGYRVQVPYGTGGHFVLTGIDKSLVYNPGRTFTNNQSQWKDLLEVYIYGK